MLKIDWTKCITGVKNGKRGKQTDGSTPPTSNTGGGKIQVCEDTVYLLAKCTVLGTSEFHKLIVEGQQLARGTKEGKWDVIIGGQKVQVWAKGASRLYPFVCDIGGLRVLYSGKAEVVEGRYNFEFQIGSAVLWRLGGLAPVWAMLRELLANWVVLIDTTLVSRCDVACDVLGVDIEQFAARVLGGYCIRRARTVVPRFAGSSRGSAAAVAVSKADATDDDAVVPVLKGLRIETVTVGTDTKVVMYDKVAELRKDPVKQALFEELWGGPQKAVTRTEFRMSRTLLRESGVFTIEDYLAHRHNLMGYLTQNWFRLTEKRVQKNHTVRAETWSVWWEIGEAISKTFGIPRYQIVRVHPCVVDGDQMERQIVGCLATVVAWKKGRDLTEAECCEALSTELQELFSSVRWTGFAERVAKAIAKARAVLGG